MQTILSKLSLQTLILSALLLSLSHASLPLHHVVDADDGEQNLTVVERAELQKTQFHWYPYQRIFYKTSPDGSAEELPECPIRPPAVEEFPAFWDRELRIRGLFLVHIFIAVYCFIALAYICDLYFLPTIERICQVLKISQDVAATTFMATATTIPEFFSNTIATFIADSDMGLSAIIGSMLFNTLGVAACASLFVKKPIQIDWWPITRDTCLFIFHLSLLITFAWDGAIMWWESCILVGVLVFYWIFMFLNKYVVRGVKYVVEERLLWCQRIRYYDIANQRPMTEEEISGKPETRPEPVHRNSFDMDRDSMDPEKVRERRKSTDLAEAYVDFVKEEDTIRLYELPRDASCFKMFWFFFTWPIKFLLLYTIPHPMRWRWVFPISFVMCIVWIAVMSYIVFWMVVIVGDTFGIPDPVMGLTFLAFGGCMPEAISAVIVARKGSGQMGVSNALGANCLAVVFSLGLPWFISTMANGAWTTDAYIRIYSYGVEWTLIAIILAALILYVTMASFSYKLRRWVSIPLIVGYISIATFAILVELDILFIKECIWVEPDDQ